MNRRRGASSEMGGLALPPGRGPGGSCPPRSPPPTRKWLSISPMSDDSNCVPTVPRISP